MKKKILIGVGILGIIFAVVVFYSSISRENVEQVLPFIDSCSQDSDCALVSGACGGGSCPLAINKNYIGFYKSLRSPGYCAVVGLAVCPPQIIAICENNKCKAISESTEQEKPTIGPQEPLCWWDFYLETNQTVAKKEKAAELINEFWRYDKINTTYEADAKLVKDWPDNSEKIYIHKWPFDPKSSHVLAINPNGTIYHYICGV